MKKATALILVLIIFSALLLTGCGDKDGGSSKPDPMANVSMEDVAVQAMEAYYGDDLKSFLPVYVPEYETAIRMDIAGYDYNGKDNRNEFVDKAKSVTQEQIDEWAAEHFTGHGKIIGKEDLVYTVSAKYKDIREVKAEDRDEFFEDVFEDEFYDGTYSKFTDFVSKSQIQDMARVKVRVEFTYPDAPSEDWGTNLELKMVKINGAWKMVSFNLAGF